jgi:hypothetical protein
MTNPRLGDVLRETGVPDLIEILGERMSPEELEAVLVEVHRQRAGRMTPGDLLARYERDPYGRPSRASATLLATIDRMALSVAAPPFEPLDLSPLCPSGTVSALAPVDPGAARSAGGESEVVSDCASVLTLECAVRRRSAGTAGSIVRLCASHREVHVPFSAPLRTDPHARVFGLCSAGADEGRFRFETGSLHEQLGIHLGLLHSLRQDGYRIGLVTVALFHQPGVELDTLLRAEVVAPRADAFPDVRLRLDGDHPLGRRYYAPVGFTVFAEDHAEVEQTIGIGSFTDWTRQLLERDEERVLVSTIATERLGEGFEQVVR